MNNSQSGIRYSDLTQTHKDLACKLSKEGMGRREMMKLSLMTGVSLVAAKSLLLDAKVAMAAEPKKGGTLRYASNLHGPDDKVDPRLFTSNWLQNGHRTQMRRSGHSPFAKGLSSTTVLI